MSVLNFSPDSLSSLLSLLRSHPHAHLPAHSFRSLTSTSNLECFTHHTPFYPDSDSDSDTDTPSLESPPTSIPSSILGSRCADACFNRHPPRRPWVTLASPRPTAIQHSSSYTFRVHLVCVWVCGYMCVCRYVCTSLSQAVCVCVCPSILVSSRCPPLASTGKGNFYVTLNWTRKTDRQLYAKAPPSQTNLAI